MVNLVCKFRKNKNYLTELKNVLLYSYIKQSTLIRDVLYCLPVCVPVVHILFYAKKKEA